MSKKIVLIDGNSIVNRAFYGVPDLTNDEGFHTNAIYGFLNIMFKILEEEKPEYLAVAFDLKAPTFRHQIFKEYKGTRKPMPDELREQIPVLKKLLKAMNIKLMEKEGYEADDILGTIARRSEAAGVEVSLVSGDRDLLQIATEHIKIRIPKTKGGKTEIEDYYTNDVLEKYKLLPQQIIELKALMGDASDNIPGVPKIGEKTATGLLLEYGNIENLKEHIQDISKKSVRETLTEHFEMAELSKLLATIDVNAPIDFSFEEAENTDLFTKEAYEIVKSLGFRNILSRFDETFTGENRLAECQITVDDFSMATEVFANCKKQPVVAFWCEFSDEENAGISLCYEQERFYFIKEGGILTKEFICDQLLQVMLHSPQTVFTAFHIKEQLPFIEEIADSLQFAKKQLFDTSIAMYLLNPLGGNYDAKERQFAALESFQKYEELKSKLAETNMFTLFSEIEMPLMLCLYRMQREGIRILPDELKAYGEELGKQIEILEKSIHEEAGEAFNINSPKQLGEILFEKMGLPGGKKTKTGYSTAADVLEKLSNDYPFVKKILEYRQLAKLKSTYADGLMNYVDENNRIHSTFHQTITATGRISSADPNLQNIPIRMEQGRLIRKVFVPKEGYVFIDADYSQIELRIMAHMSGDEKLIDAYNNNEDIHSMTASEVFHTPIEEVTPLQRRNAKAVNFGIIYGISSFGLSQDLSITRKEAKEYIDRYFEIYQKVKTYLDKLVEDAKQDGYVTTLYGRRRPIPELKSSNFMQRSFGERVAMNAPIQGTAADIMKIAMIHVMEALDAGKLKSKLVLQIHDELLIETALDEQKQVEQILEDAMKHAAELAVNLEIDMHTGSNWYDAK